MCVWLTHVNQTPCQAPLQGTTGFLWNMSVPHRLSPIPVLLCGATGVDCLRLHPLLNRLLHPSLMPKVSPGPSRQLLLLNLPQPLTNMISTFPSNSWSKRKKRSCWIPCSVNALPFLKAAAKSSKFVKIPKVYANTCYLLLLLYLIFINGDARNFGGG